MWQGRSQVPVGAAAPQSHDVSIQGDQPGRGSIDRSVSLERAACPKLQWPVRTDVEDVVALAVSGDRAPQGSGLWMRGAVEDDVHEGDSVHDCGHTRVLLQGCTDACSVYQKVDRAAGLVTVPRPLRQLQMTTQTAVAKLTVDFVVSVDVARHTAPALTLRLAVLAAGACTISRAAIARSEVAVAALCAVLARRALAVLDARSARAGAGAALCAGLARGALA